MATAKTQSINNGAILEGNVEAIADAEKTLLEPGNFSLPAQKPAQGLPPIPWHILFPPGHPMHGASRS